MPSRDSKAMGAAARAAVTGTDRVVATMTVTQAAPARATARETTRDAMRAKVRDRLHAELRMSMEAGSLDAGCRQASEHVFQAQAER
jgi:hypothetical protein